MQEFRLNWRPPARTESPSLAVEAISKYLDKKARFVLFENGTALLLKPELDRPQVIAGAMHEVRMKSDFNCMPMRDGNFLVWIASPVCVFISSVEAIELAALLKADPTVALLPGESFLAAPANPDHYLVGLAARAKAHADSMKQIQVARHEPTLLAKIQ